MGEELQNAICKHCGKEIFSSVYIEAWYHRQRDIYIYCLDAAGLLTEARTMATPQVEEDLPLEE